MKEKPDKEHFIPLVICGKCGEETPLSYQCTMQKNGHEDIEIWSTACCDIIPLDESEIKGYLSIQDLKDMGYETTS